MNKRIIILGVIIGLIVMYYGYYYFQRQNNILDQENVVIQTNCSSGSTNNDGCACSENSECLSGDCYSGTCQSCRRVSQSCYDDGQCCNKMLCDTTSGTPGICGVGILTVGATAVAAGGAAYTYHNTGQWVGGKRYSKNIQFEPIYDEDINVKGDLGEFQNDKQVVQDVKEVVAIDGE